MTDDTATRIGAGLGSAFGFFIGGAVSLMASGWIVGKNYGTEVGDSEQNMIGVVGAALGAVIGASLGVPSDTGPIFRPVSPDKATVGVSRPPLRFP